MIEVYQLPPNRMRPSRSPCAESKSSSAREYVQAAFDALVAGDSGFGGLVTALQERRLRVVVFGGWARDRLAEHMFGAQKASRDIDLVCDGTLPVADVFPPGSLRNPFGGVGFDGSVIHVDAWNLSETFLIRRYALPVDFSQLPGTADYNINAILFRPSQFFSEASLLDCGAGEALRRRELDFMADEVAQPRIQAARSVMLSARFDLRLSDTVRRFVMDTCSTRVAVEAVAAGVVAYCPAKFRSRALARLHEMVRQE